MATEESLVTGGCIVLLTVTSQKVFTWLSELLSHLRWVHSALGAEQLDLQMQKNRKREREREKFSVIIQYEDLMFN